MKFYIDIPSAHTIVSDINGFKKELGQIENHMKSVSDSLKTFRAYDNIYRNLTRTQNNVENLINILAHMENGLDQAVNLYLQCEQGILSETNGTLAQSRLQGMANNQAADSILDWCSNWLSGFGRMSRDKANEARNDKAMAKDLKNLLKNDKYNKKTWKKASVEERKEILRELFEDMKEIYGIDVSQINIVPIETDPGYITYGFLSYSEGGYMEMTINSELLEHAKDYNQVMNTMVHELRHGYQHSVVDHPERYEVSEVTMEKWKDNFNDYKTTDEDGYAAYRKQIVEKDARKFADKVI